jgi:hypothetical protein
VGWGRGQTNINESKTYTVRDNQQYQAKKKTPKNNKKTGPAKIEKDI